MEKKLIVEIQRISNLMGVQKKLITESSIIGKISDSIKDFIEKEAKPYMNSVDQLIVGSQIISKREIDNILNVCDNPSLFNTLTETEKNIFASLIRKSEDIVNTVYDDLVRNIMEIQGTSEESLMKFISEQRKNGKTVREILTDMFGGDEFAANVLSPKISKKVTDYVNGKFTPQIAKRVVNPKRFQKPMTQISELSSEYLNKLKKAYGTGWFRAFQKFKLTILDMFKNEEKKIDEILSVIKTLKSTTDDPEQYVALTKRLSDLFLDLTKTQKENFAYITKWIEDNDSKKILDDLIKSEETLGLDGYQKALKISNGKAYAELQMGWKKLKQRRSEALDQFFTFINPFNWFGKRLSQKYGEESPWVKNVGKQWQDLLGFYKTNKGDTKEISTRFERLRRELFFGSTKSKKEVSDIINNLGYKSYTADRLMEYAYSIVVSTVILSFCDFVREFLANNVLQYIDWWVKNTDWVSEQAKQWDEKKYQNIVRMNTERKKQFAEILKSIFGSKSDAVLGLFGLGHSVVQSVGSNFTSEVTIPGWMDDLLILTGIDWFKVLQSDSGLKETVEKLETTVDTLENKVKSDTALLKQGNIPDWSKVDSTQKNDSVPVKKDSIPGVNAPDGETDTLKKQQTPGW